MDTEEFFTITYKRKTYKFKKKNLELFLKRIEANININNFYQIKKIFKKYHLYDKNFLETFEAINYPKD